MTKEKKVVFTTQGRRNPEVVDEQQKGTSRTIDDHKGDRLSWGSLEQDKWEVLFSVYGRNNIRFGI